MYKVCSVEQQPACLSVFLGCPACISSVSRLYLTVSLVSRVSLYRFYIYPFCSNIGRVSSILTFEQFTKRAVHHGLRDAPLSENQYERLLKGITSQKPWQTLITWLSM